MPSTGDPAHNPGTRPDWESNQGLFDLWAVTQPLSHTSQDRIKKNFKPIIILWHVGFRRRNDFLTIFKEKYLLSRNHYLPLVDCFA